MTSEDQTLLYKAAADPNGQIALKRSRCGEWHADRDRLDVLAGAVTCSLWVREWARILEGRSPSGRSRRLDEPSPTMPVQPYGAEPTTDESVAQPCSADRGVPSAPVSRVRVHSSERIEEVTQVLGDCSAPGQVFIRDRGRAHRNDDRPDILMLPELSRIGPLRLHQSVPLSSGLQPFLSLAYGRHGCSPVLEGSITQDAPPFMPHCSTRP